METLRVAVCEDTDAECQSLLHILEGCQYPTTVSVFTSGEEFLGTFHPHQYDLIMMDIFMKGITGVDVVTKVRLMDHQVPVVFITSSRDFALESYRLSVLKYIEKPATKPQVVEALQLAQMKQQSVEKLVIRTNATAVAYPLAQILYLEQKGKYLMVHLLGGQQIPAAKKLAEVEDQLADKNFFRCHKSYLVNLAFVQGIDRELSTFTMAQGGQVHIRRESFWAAKKAFEAYLFASETEVQYG